MLNRIYFILVFSVCFIVLVCIYPFTLVGGDEGLYAQRAMLLGKGMVPIADYAARAPVLLGLLWGAVKLFGSFIFTLRLPIIILSSLTAGFIFLLGKELFNYRTGLIAGFLYGLSPFNLWSGQLIKSEITAILFMVLSALFLIKGLKKEKRSFLVFSGVFLGLGFIERHSVLAFGLPAGLAIILWTFLGRAGDLKNKIKVIVCKAGFFGIGGIIGFLPIFLWVAYHNLGHALKYWFGIFSLAPRPPLFAVAGFFSYEMLRSWALAFIETLATQGGLLFSGLVFFLLGFVQLIFIRCKKIGEPLMFLIFILFFGALAWHSSLTFFLGTFRPLVFLCVFIFSSVIFLFLWIYSIHKNNLREYLAMHQRESWFLIIWFGGFMLAYSLWRPGYLREFMVVIALMTSLTLASVFWKDIRKTALCLFIIGAMGIYGTGIAWFQNPKFGGWWWTQDVIRKTTEFIKQNTFPGEEIFTANPLPAILAGRRAFFDISPFSIYYAKDFSKSFGFYPSPEEVFERLQTDPPRYTLVDKRMEKYIFSSYSVFEDFVRENYEFMFAFGEGKGEIQIWKRKF